MSDTPTTYRGRSLEEVLPQVRTELGANAVVLARREGLEGGVGGFFQRPFVEVDAVTGDEPEPAPAPARGADALMATLRAASAELAGREAVAGGAGLYGPQPTVMADAPPAPAAAPVAAADPAADAAAGDLTDRLVPPAAMPGFVPFAEALAAAEASPPLHELVAAAPQVTLPEPALVAEEQPVAAAAQVEVAAAPEPPAPVFETPQPAAPAPVVPAPQPVAAAPAPAPQPAVVVPAAAPAVSPVQKAATALVQVLTDAGVPHAFATDVVAGAVTHGLAFGTPRQLKTLVRAALAERLPTMGPLPTGPRTVVVVGGAGAGKTTAATRLAEAYAAAGQVAVRTLGVDDPALHEPFPGLTVVDAPAIRVRDKAVIGRLAERLAPLDAEVHIALPATHSASAVADLVAAAAPLRPTHALLTHADETAAPGAALVRAAQSGLRLSYVSGAGTLSPANALELAKRLI